MRKITIFLILTFLCVNSIAQPVNLLSNPEINPGTGCPIDVLYSDYGNNQELYPPGCYTFTRLPNPNIPQQTPCIPANWFRTHGTPVSYETIGSSWPHHIAMSSVNNSGVIESEGVFAAHNFIAGTTYYIHIEVLTPMAGGIINIRIVDNTQLNTETAVTSCWEVKPSVPSLNIVTVANIYSDPNKLSYTFKITLPTPVGSNFWNKLWIVPETNTDSYFHFRLDNVYVFDKNPCGDDIIYTQTGVSVPAGVHNEKSFIAGSNNSAITFVDPNAATTWHARKTELISTFKAEMNADNYFLVAAEECGFQIYTPPSSKPSKNSNSTQVAEDNEILAVSIGKKSGQVHHQTYHQKQIRIYPNPTTGSFTVQMPQSGNYTIRVMNLVGSTIYEGKMEGEQKKSIQLNRNLPPGNYTIHIHGDGLRHVEKLVITK